MKWEHRGGTQLKEDAVAIIDNKELGISINFSLVFKTNNLINLLLMKNEKKIRKRFIINIIVF